MKLIPLTVATAVVAGTLLAAPSTASAVQAPGPAPSVTVTDPAGDVLDAGATTRFKARATDVSRAVYTTQANRGTKDDKTDRIVTLEVEHRRSLLGKGFDVGQLLVVTFTSGGLRYKATTGSGGLTYVDADGRRRGAGTSYGASFGGGVTQLSFSADALEGDTLTDIRATLRVVGSRTRDVVALAPGPLQVGARS